MELTRQSKKEMRENVQKRFQVGDKIKIDSKCLGWRTDAAQKKTFEIVSFHSEFVVLKTKEGFTCSLQYWMMENYAEPCKRASGSRWKNGGKAS